jgi:hypothetical protein
MKKSVQNQGSKIIQDNGNNNTGQGQKIMSLQTQGPPDQERSTTKSSSLVPAVVQLVKNNENQDDQEQDLGDNVNLYTGLRDVKCELLRDEGEEDEDFEEEIELEHEDVEIFEPGHLGNDHVSINPAHENDNDNFSGKALQILHNNQN